ncbi:hypothetical protein Bca52824_066908 [Brassica carinata]|uniref:non-specific serine/threonine protein kinase n=1 Tax=Brassica carinata TaxID=52824 RepID=A0A8X7QMD4_BRACI|nr:hypothetical protein Bca52824_066908 [Brassica carinata]
MAGVNLQLRLSVAQLFPAVSSSPPSPSRVIFSNLRANSAAAPALRTTRRSNTVSASSVGSSTSSGSLVGDGDEAGRRMPLLEVKDLRAVIVESRQEILKGVNLVVYEGEIHAVMGKNGSGKSTFSKVLVGHPDYEVTGGSIVFKGQNLLDMEPEERSLAGLFMSFQSPVEIPGFYSHLVSKLEVVNMKTDFLNRNVNEGFSGGERKRNEILQLAVLGAELAILDEIDSGLDVDALQDVAKAVNGLLTPKNSVLMITHYQRLLDYIKPTLIHIMENGRIIKTGDKSLAKLLEKEGYKAISSGPNIPGNGLLQTVSAALWKPRIGAEQQASSHGNAQQVPKEAAAEVSKEAVPDQVQNKPPEQVTMPNPSSIPEAETKSRPEPEEAKKEVGVQVETSTKPETKPESNPEPTKPETKSDTSPETKPDPNKPKHMRRLSSAGLRTESVLQRKTENFKEFYSLGRKLGQGQFGTTFLCLEKAPGKSMLAKEDVEDVRREIQIMHHLAGHPNVISIKGAYEDVVAVHLVMELCSGGELFDRIIQRGHYTERKAAELARTIVGVLETCHSLGVMHRDLKPENFLFVSREEDSLLKTIDFGLSMFFKPDEVFTDVVGSPYYVAPEVLRKRYGPESDVWSAGVIVYILLSGVPPFWAETEQGIFEQVLHGDLDFSSDPWPSISDGAKDLVQKMLVRDPKRRLTAHQVLCHPWVQIDGVAPDKPLDSAVLSRMKQFSAMNKFKKMALRVIAESLSEEEIAGLKEMFKMIDADNSGQITFEELKAGLKRVGANLKESEILDLMQAADVDNSGTIDYKEFIAATLHLNKIEKEDHLFAAFSYFDKDGSGYITPDELQHACEEFGDGRIDYNEFVAMMQKGSIMGGPMKMGLEKSISVSLKH